MWESNPQHTRKIHANYQTQLIYTIVPIFKELITKIKEINKIKKKPLWNHTFYKK